MTNALDFFGAKDLFDFGFNPIKTFFGDFVPSNFTNSPKVNVKETDKAYEIEIANPGFTKDETNIKIEDNVIYVSMTNESKEGQEDENHKYHVKQWSKSSYQEFLSEEENPLTPINKIHSYMKKFMRNHEGFSRDNIQDWMNLISFIINDPENRYDKLKLFLKMAISAPKKVRFRDVMSKKG